MNGHRDFERDLYVISTATIFLPYAESHWISASIKLKASFWGYKLIFMVKLLNPYFGGL